MTHLLAFLGLIALLLSTACAMLTLLLAIALTMHGSAISPLALAAGIMDVLGIGWVAYLLAGITFKDHVGVKKRKLPTITLMPSMLFLSIAVSLTFATLIWVHIKSTTTMSTIFGNRIYLINKIDFGFWAATVIAQSLFIALCFHEPHNDETAVQDTGLPLDLVDNLLHIQQEPQGVPQPVPLRNLNPIPAIPLYTRSITSSHSVSSFSSDGKSTVRSSFHGAVRPVTSRSRLIRQNSWAGPSNSTVTLPLPRQKQTCNSTLSSRRSSTDQTVADDMTPPQTPVKTRLETIPGSRANSPARALDGPFPEQPLIEEMSTTHEDSRTTSPKITTGTAEAEIHQESTIDESRIPPRFRKDPQPSQSTSPTIDQSLIHPLFRTDNSLPAPTATLGTTVIASAFGGQCMTPRSLSRVTTRSRPTSPERTESTVRTRARSHSRPPTRPTDQLVSPPSAVRAKSMEVVQTRKALFDISGNAATTVISSSETPKMVQQEGGARTNNTFHIAVDDE